MFSTGRPSNYAACLDTLFWPNTEAVTHVSFMEKTECITMSSGEMDKVSQVSVIHIYVSFCIFCAFYRLDKLQIHILYGYYYSKVKKKKRKKKALLLSKDA